MINTSRTRVTSTPKHAGQTNSLGKFRVTQLAKKLSCTPCLRSTLVRRVSRGLITTGRITRYDHLPRSPVYLLTLLDPVC